MRAIQQAVIALALLVMLPAAIAAQGVQTGELSGVVSSNDGLSMPGATVTIQMPAIQGTRTAVTDANGSYVVRALPPGTYKVTFEMAGLATEAETRRRARPADRRRTPTLAVAGVAENVTVDGRREHRRADVPDRRRQLQTRDDQRPADGPHAVTDRRAGAGPDREHAERRTGHDLRRLRLRQRVHDQRRRRQRQPVRHAAQRLHRGRDPADAGADVRHLGRVRPLLRRRHQHGHQERRQHVLRQLPQQPPNNAVDGRDAAREGGGHRTARQAEQNYEATFGGPILRDRLWFFSAGRWQDTSSAETLPETNLRSTRPTKNKRFEIKGTGTLATWPHRAGRTTSATPTDETAPAVRRLDRPQCRRAPAASRTACSSPATTACCRRSCSRTSRSRRRSEGFRGTGGTDTDIHASPFLTRGAADGVPGSLHYNGNYFDATDPEDRDNRQFAGSLSYFLSTRTRGSHDIKGGVRALHVEPDRRQLAERHRLRLRHATTCPARAARRSTRAAASSRRSCPA